MSEARLKSSDMIGAGMGVPGVVDFGRGRVPCLTNVPGWKNVPVRRIMRSLLRLPVFVDNDVNVMALGELAHGAGKGCKDLICLTLGTGVGGAIITDGKLYRGADYAAGEIGHIPINETGPRCNCGGKGCLEAYGGNRRLLTDARRRLKRHKGSIIRKPADGRSSITLEIIAAAARKGDALSLSLWRGAGTRIGIALVGVVNVYNPERIVIGGGVAEAGEALFGPIRDTIRQRAMKVQAHSVKVMKAVMGADAGLIGAGELVKTEIS